MQEITPKAARPDVEAIIYVEQQVLGAVLMAGDLYHTVSSRLSANHFLDAVHQDIWKRIEARVQAEHPISAVTLARDMEHHDGLAQLGGPGYLVRLAGAAISPRALPDYVGEIIDAWQARQIFGACEDAQNALREADGVAKAKGVLERTIVTLPDDHGKPNSVSMLGALHEAVQQAAEAYQGGGAALQTGFRAIDDKTGGLWPGDYVILGGRPSMGKTALAVSMAVRVARAGAKVGIVSIEMTEASLAQRILAEKANVSYSDLRKGNLTEDEMRRVIEGAKEMQDLPITFTPPRVRDVSAIHAAMKAERARMGGLDLVIVDYLQLVRAPGRSRYEQMTEASIQMKTMAKLLNCPVVVLAQLSRGVEERDNKRPTLSDLKESGQIEQDADAVFFCYRHSYYLERQGPPKSPELRADYEAALAATKNRIDVICAKQRMGPIFTATLGCHLPTNRFWNIEDEAGEANMLL